MLQVTVSGNSREELIANLASWIDLLSGQRVGDQQLSTEEKNPEPKKRGRPAKVQQEPETLPLPTEAQAVKPEEQAIPTGPPPSTLTLESTITALKGVAALRPGDTGPTDGYQRVSKILVNHGYKNVKEIRPEHYAVITAECAVPA